MTIQELKDLIAWAIEQKEFTTKDEYSNCYLNDIIMEAANKLKQEIKGPF